MSTLLLAWRYTWFYRGRSALLTTALTLLIFLPLATRWVTLKFEKAALARAQQTPLIVGSKGSRFAVALHALYFRGESPAAMKYSEAERLEEFKLAQIIPLHFRYRASGKPIIGTTPDYFTLRKLLLQTGEPMSRLGDCVIGATAANELTVNVGDQLTSESDNVFDLSGATPLRMQITGILQPSGTADDDAVFCSLKTAWIMEGIGHGHSVQGESSSEHVHQASRQNLSQHQQVTDANVGSFHFHGNASDYPITAIIALPDSERSSTLLLGKYLDTKQLYQVIQPVEVIAELMEAISRVRNLFEIGILSLIVAASLLIALVMLLSLRLRQRELRTMFLLGCSRIRVVQIVCTELLLVLFVSASLAIIAAFILSASAESLMIRLI